MLAFMSPINPYLQQLGFRGMTGWSSYADDIGMCHATLPAMTS